MLPRTEFSQLQSIVQCRKNKQYEVILLKSFLQLSAMGDKNYLKNTIQMKCHLNDGYAG